MEVEVWCQTDVGKKRAENQDSFLMDPDLGLYVVADGMGGHNGGEVASSMAVESVRNVVLESFQNEVGVMPRDLLQRACATASESIFNASIKDSKLSGMGTTLVATLCRDNAIYIANVGDSRAYLVRDHHIWQITEDHSLINEQIKAGLLKPEESSAFPGKNVITRSVGFEKSVLCDVIERKAVPGDRFLICSDGLTGMVSDHRILEITEKNEPSHVALKLIDEANKNGGEDNVTAMFILVK